jgi:type III restriction enzyme
MTEEERRRNNEICDRLIGDGIDGFSELDQGSRVSQLAYLAAIRPAQGELVGVVEPVDVSAIVAATTHAYVEKTIDIPRITVVPSGEVTVGYNDFDLDCSSVHYPPVAKDLLIQRLTDNQRFRIVSGDGVVAEERLEDYIVRGLIDKDDISYDDHAALLYKLAGQLVRHVQSYLSNEDDVRNVLQYHQSELVRLVHTQMRHAVRQLSTCFVGSNATILLPTIAVSLKVILVP